MKKLIKNSQKDLEPAGEQMTSFSLAGSRNRANRTAPQESDWEKKMNDTFGPKCYGLFDLFDPVGSSGRTFTELLVGMKGWFSTRCKLTWKRKGTKYGRTYYQLAASTLRTEGTGFGLLPTTQARDWKGAQGRGYKGEAMDLPTLAMNGILPTPNTMDTLPPKEGEAMERIAQGARKGRTAPSNLREYVNPKSWEAYGMLPTPNARDWKGKQANEYKQDRGEDTSFKMQSLCGVAEKMSSHQIGHSSQKLNPQFVLEMMGFPPNWTELPFLSGETNQSKPQEMR